MITDYSSVMFDVYGSNKAILFFPYDFDAYQENVSDFYFPYDKVVNGKVYYEFIDFVNGLKSFDFKDSGNEIMRNRFFCDTNVSSSDELFGLILKKLESSEKEII